MLDAKEANYRSNYMLKLRDFKEYREDRKQVKELLSPENNVFY